jgi:hypothetical protein
MGGSQNPQGTITAETGAGCQCASSGFAAPAKWNSSSAESVPLLAEVPLRAMRRLDATAAMK